MSGQDRIGDPFLLSFETEQLVHLSEDTVRQIVREEMRAVLREERERAEIMQQARALGLDTTSQPELSTRTRVGSVWELRWPKAWADR